MADAMNTRELIQQVRKRSVIYDTNHEQYASKEAKESAWMEIVAMCVEPDASEADWANTMIQLQKRWKHLRDNYIREKRRLIQGDGNMAKKKRYIHYNLLKFLSYTPKVSPLELKEGRPKKETGKVMKSIPDGCKTMYHTPNKQRHKDRTPEPTTTKIETKSPEPKTTKTETKSLEPKTIKIDTKSPEERMPKVTYVAVEAVRNRRTESYLEDGDRLFLLSLLGDLKRVADHLKLEAKYEVMAVIKKFLSYSNSHMVFERHDVLKIKEQPISSSDESDN